MRLTTQRAPEGGYQWAITWSPQHPEAVARGTHAYPDLESCARAAKQVFVAEPGAIRPVEQPTGGWRWVVSGPDGSPVAESSATYDNAATCGYALYELRHALARHSHDIAQRRRAVR
ncbi:MAG TPA: hypothetical protein VFR11_13980 [Micromonosporaceae bacterium]|jgi:hypothetical protein|nr:hypothetical protein [Micromonosporaceae bacterium]